MAVMCGRYGRSSRLDAIEVYLDSLPGITEEEDWHTTYNAAPGVAHPIVRVKPNGAESTIRSVLWGFLPFWAKSPTDKRLINAKNGNGPPTARVSAVIRAATLPGPSGLVL